MEVNAPTPNAVVVCHVFAWSTQKNTIAPIIMMNTKHILYSDQIKADAPYLIIMPIYTTPGCEELSGCLRPS